MEKQGIVIASFGTTHPETRERSIGAIEAAAAAAFPGVPVRRAFTSGMVRRYIGQAEGKTVDSPQACLQRMAQEGFTHLTVQPTHIIHGEEYEKLAEQVRAAAPDFAEIRLGAPLLNSAADYFALIDAMLPAYGLKPGEALVWMGHGSAHFADAAYAALEKMLRDRGVENVYVGTVEGYPTFETVCAALARDGVKKVRLAPLMVVAGDHALNDMSGGDQSWQTRLEKLGFETACTLRGLGEYPAVQRIYLEHLRCAPIVPVSLRRVGLED